MATSPASSPASSIVTAVGKPSTPSPNPPSERNASSPDTSLSPSNPSPPPASPPAVQPNSSSPPPIAASSSPPPPTPSPPPSPVDAPPPSSPSSTHTPTTPLPPVTITPPAPSPPSNPPPSHPMSPPPSTPSSPPPPTSKSPSPVSQLSPPPVPKSTHSPPPPSTNPARPSPPPKTSPSPPAKPPTTNSPPPTTNSSSPLPLTSPPPAFSSTPSSLFPSPVSSSSPNSTATSLTPSKGGLPLGGVVAIGFLVGFIMLGIIGLVAFFMSKRKRRDFKHSGGYIVPSAYGSSPRSDSNLIVKTVVSSSTPFVRSTSGSGTLSPHSHGGLGQSRSWFTYQELYEATNGFALEDLLGEGGFGCVYKGVLANGREIAVKQLKIGGSQGEREFQAEVEIISRIHHRHLVSLVGYCISESKRLLVYEYVSNQTLYYHLHGQNRPVMDWATRIKIVVGAARGITYLHEDCHPRIIHRDIKSSNILLDDKFEARVADFGLAKLAMDVDTHVSTRVMGTFGYMAPEYATSGKLTDKSDVFSFGVVLLELLTGRKPVDGSQPLGDESLVEWARPLLSHALETGQVEGLVDPRLEKNYVESELFLMIEAAAACVRHSATKRPRMGQVVRAFDGLSPSDLSNGMRVGQSEIYDSAQESAEIRWFRRMAFGSQEYSTDYFSEAARNTGHLNPNPNNQGPFFSTQPSQNDSPQQQSQNIYFSSHRTQGPTFSGQWSQNCTALRQSSQNPTFSGLSNGNVDSYSSQSQLLE